MSKGEDKIRKWLRKEKIKYVSQKRFKGCKLERPLPFDFYLPEKKILIEYQGKQHYQPVKLFGGNKPLKLQRKRDKIKKAYAKKRGIKLVTISYKMYYKLEKVLKRKLK